MLWHVETNQGCAHCRREELADRHGRPDTGLQFDEGPSQNRYLTASARHYFRAGLLQASVSKADALDLSDGTPVPEAPRLIMDVLEALDRLAFSSFLEGSVGNFLLVSA
jgi:hypothetical protein